MVRMKRMAEKQIHRGGETERWRKRKFRYRKADRQTQRDRETETARKKI
jgi:hypothetical protein